MPSNNMCINERYGAIPQPTCLPADTLPRSTGRGIRKNLWGDRGLTLIEVLVAVTILVVVAVALLDTIQLSLRSSRNNRDLSKAIYLTKCRMAELEERYSRKPNRAMGTDHGDYGEDYPGYRWETEAEENRKEEAWYLTARTFWGKDSEGRERQYVLASIVPRFKEHPDQEVRKRRQSEGQSRRSGGHNRTVRERGRPGENRPGGNRR